MEKKAFGNDREALFYCFERKDKLLIINKFVINFSTIHFIKLDFILTLQNLPIFFLT